MVDCQFDGRMQMVEKLYLVVQALLSSSNTCQYLVSRLLAFYYVAGLVDSIARPSHCRINAVNKTTSAEQVRRKPVCMMYHLSESLNICCPKHRSDISFGLLL